MMNFKRDIVVNDLEKQILGDKLREILSFGTKVLDNATLQFTYCYSGTHVMGLVCLKRINKI